MKKVIFYIFLIFSTLGFSQETISELLKRHNSESVPYISVQELAMPKTEVVLLDSRELIEFETSHLKDAIYVGYDNFKLEDTTKLLNDKQQTIVVYCSLGIRSEDIAEQLKRSGYTNVYNLFGGIFEWKNNDFTVYNTTGETENVHAFSKDWSQWLLKGTKIYD
ncbi:rhodanese-like domain-containing protein [Winogradskyella bathintestinalis]|uniref:Rhodanese-like domain-containing protein n=1 Tax=Winogradskyella bathintestinalis TaxID=3035208 RepID=A0ABT7ZQ86_9FLAO|nr:rhodanese-like domain-containing protein [Winogradskyella bathintestinalis]MDN3491177.1 rhodanese-like domain-containing protein [Winogradskyella bathintestinalis]